jgi:hypothetical protein
MECAPAEASPPRIIGAGTTATGDALLVTTTGGLLYSVEPPDLRR